MKLCARVARSVNPELAKKKKGRQRKTGYQKLDKKIENYLNIEINRYINLKIGSES